jgi:hypothetical protein
MPNHPAIQQMTPIEVPTSVVWAGLNPLVEYRRIDANQLRGRHFFELAAEGKITRVVPLDQLPDDGPSAMIGSIHHMWRCGSTLLCRQLSVLPRVIALSEPYLFSNLLIGHPQPADLLHRRLRQLATTLSEALRPLADRIVIKWPGLLAQHAGELAAAFPAMRSVFLHRDPIEVLASIEQRPLGPTLSLPSRYFGAKSFVDPDSLAAVASLLECNISAMRGRSEVKSCNYTRLTGDGTLAVANWLNLPFADDSTAQIAEITRWDAKRSPHSQQFSDDSLEKQRKASKLARDLADTLVAPSLSLTLASLSEV